MTTGYQILRLFLDKAEKIQLALCLASLATIVVVLILEILLRHLGINLQWALDLSALLMVWICFIGASVVFRRKGHIGIDALVRLFPPVWQKALNIIMYLTIGAGFFVLAEKAVRLMMVQWGQEIVSLGISRSFLSLPMILGIGMMLVTSVYLILEEIRGEDQKKAAIKEEEGYDESY